MPLPNWPKVPLEYVIHRLATRNDWEASKAKRLSQPPYRKAQYNPLILDRSTIAAMELFCIENGTILTPMGDLQKQHNFFMDCRGYLNDQHVEVGYCDGSKVHFIFVKWNEKGYHGYPATASYLRSKGAKL